MVFRLWKLWVLGICGIVLWEVGTYRIPQYGHQHQDFPMTHSHGLSREIGQESTKNNQENEQKDKQIPICDQDERRYKVEQYCSSHPPREDMNASMPQLRKILHEAMIVDDENKVLICLHAKVGCSTWKWIMVNNTARDPVPMERRNVDVHNLIWRSGMRRVTDKIYSDDDIAQRLENYYKVMVVRHPYDRLASLYREKFGEDNKIVRESLGRRIVKLYHPSVPDSANAGRVSFSDLVHYIEDGHRNVHWDAPYMINCAPCRVHYDYIVKLETQDKDASYIIKNKLKGRGIGTSANKKRAASSSSMLGSGRALAIHQNLTAGQLTFLRQRLQPDMEMFGYSFDEGKALAKCQYGENTCC